MVQISQNASTIIAKMLEKNGLAGGGLRIAIKAGGCSGFSYVFGWEASPKETDLVFEGSDGARVFIDPKSHRLLDGTTLDYDTGLLSKGFIFQNPNAKSTCGCGTSFSA
jgi:iron-sulfur cluster assembly protein